MDLAAPEPCQVQGWGEGFKKNPQPSSRRLGILPALTLHSLFLEDLSVKDIQTRFSDSPALSAAFPSLDNLMTVATHLLKGFPFRKGRDYSGGSVPDFPH
jgi:hypothetical protein